MLPTKSEQVENHPIKKLKKNVTKQQNYQ